MLEHSTSAATLKGSPNHVENVAAAQPFSRRFFDQTNKIPRNIFLHAYLGACLFVIIAIFTILAIYWGSLWKTPVQTIPGWVVDFDTGVIGRTVVQGMTSGPLPGSRVAWTAVNASQFSLSQLLNAIHEQKTWVAVVINEGATARLQSSLATPSASYNGSDAITVYAEEARNENAFRNLVRPSVEATLTTICQSFASQSANNLVSSSNITSVLSTSPQTITMPIWYTLDNLIPFNVPVATAVTFVGLIYQYILTFFVVSAGFAAREVSGLNRHLTLRSLIAVRFISSLGSFFIIALFYSFLSLAFLVKFDRHYGSSGFVIFWMINWLEMSSTGLALDAMMPILTLRFIPFFMLLWVMVNVSVALYPLEVLPSIYRYGYAAPFYNVSRAIRSIVFGTKNTLGLNFGVLIAWTAISCITMPLIQWYIRRKAIIAERVQLETQVPIVPNMREA